MMVSFTPQRADTIRANLINHVAENPVPRRRPALWAAGLVLAGALAGAGASAALASSGLFDSADMYARVPDYGPSPDYVLALKPVDAEVDVPKDPHDTLNLLGLSPGDLQQYEDFETLNIWSGEPEPGVSCLLIAHPSQGLLEGIGDARCAPDGLDTIADIPVCSNCTGPSGLFTSLPTGGLVRFVLSDDHVDVYVYVRAAYPSGPSS
jgi:hypothetical protein